MESRLWTQGACNLMFFTLHNLKYIEKMETESYLYKN